MDRITNITNARNNLFELVDDVLDNNQVVKITSKKGNVVLLSDEDYSGMVETVYLTRHKKTHEEIVEGLRMPVTECAPVDLPWLFK
jgi:PHD/YefM family antitoxin component YafN of YafNO toxin-antitoxin module